jgi:hypothetical protein
MGRICNIHREKREKRKITLKWILEKWDEMD